MGGGGGDYTVPTGDRCFFDSDCRTGRCEWGRSATLGVCRDTLVDGEGCNEHNDCDSLFCDNAQCVPKSNEGGDCDIDENCTTDWCREGECHPKYGEGHDCEGDEMCVSGR